MSYGNENKLSKSLLVVRRNPLIEAKFKATPLEYKILMTAASKISPNDKTLKDIEFSVDEFCKIMDVKSEGMYDYLKRSCERLVGKPVTLKDTAIKDVFPEIEVDDEGWIVFPWLHHIKYFKRKGLIKIRFHEYISPLLLYIAGNKEYTKIVLENINKCDSFYSMRIYELLKQYQKIGERTIEISELREMLGIDKKEYKLYGDFKRYVLEQAFKEINSKTDLEFEFKEIKTGRKVTSIKFTLNGKRQLEQADEYNNLDILPKEQLEKLLQLEIKNRYVVSVDITLINGYSQRVILKLLKDLKKGLFDRTNIYSPLGFFMWKLEEISSMLQEE